MNKLSVNLPGIELKNPIIIASGPLIHGEYFNSVYDLSELGAITTKTVTYLPKEGNKTPRFASIEGGYINAVGLKNIGIKKFVETKIELLEMMNVPVITSIAGNSIEEYVEMVEMLNDAKVINAIELNVSCPNVKKDSIIMTSNYDYLNELITNVKKASHKPIYVKLSPTEPDIVQTARVCKEAGADALTMINGLSGMKIDIKTMKPVLSNKFGGVSGSFLKPLAIKLVYQVSSEVDIPIIGVGGIANVEDAIEMLMAGATAVGIASANMWDPLVCYKIATKLEEELNKLGFSSVQELINKVKESRKK
ncbi:dihydroorotate dehydrogenase [Spiroplasma turonicum]|uniref:Dihydroorotate dehydrogenase n=1 Tax=Spiroplasma turonicum TaxID=216946 RepID=A0A0K1P6W6_9MOLU|nr:dihydroorotate dehydrogenase [Spiroplasma turonicum]AKU80051.1 dihydroorotate dehydrogenase [Spiroplasma turonicum]ALX71053.1 dihydroorotate dehydrogenase (NAD+) catalytic subunit [Spiroplasma turonicum]